MDLVLVAKIVTRRRYKMNTQIIAIFVIDLLCILQMETNARSAGKGKRNLIHPPKSRKTHRNTDSCIHNVCNETINYPANKINRLLKEQKIDISLFGGAIMKTTEDNIVVSRFQPREKNMCETRTFVMSPKKIKFTPHIYVVQTEEMEQLIQFEICAHSDSSCSLHQYLPDGYSTSCKQKMVSVQMLVYDSLQGVLKKDNVPVPGGCVCHYFSF